VPAAGVSRRALVPIPGAPPDLLRLPPGCPFAPRCAYHVAACDDGRPPLMDLGGGRASACIRAADLARLEGVVA
jgi:oligopeptide/dipeptide ABC transporter ATP-binding protein